MNGEYTEYMYSYETVVTFSNPVTHHDIMLRCVPAENTCQHIVCQHLVMHTGFKVMHGTDAYGNNIIYGGTHAPHDVLAYFSTGIIRCTDYAISDSHPAAYYDFPTRLTMFSPSMSRLMPQGEGNTMERAAEICHNIHRDICYVPLSTTMTTSAAEVMAQRKGVCQDMAHLMIAVCRRCGIKSRYANGLLLGTGVTHAWVEVWNDGVWTAMDPTHDTLVRQGYIKIAHGRDANDCPVSRGTYIGEAGQQTSVRVTVVRIGESDRTSF